MHPQIKKLERHPVSTVNPREKVVNTPLVVLFFLHFKNCLQLLPCKHVNHTFSTCFLCISRDSSSHVSKTSFRSKSALTKIKRYPSQSLAIVFFKVLTVLLKM